MKILRQVTRCGKYALWMLLPAIALAAGDAVRKDADAGLVRIEETEVIASNVGHIVLLKAQNMVVPIFVDAIVAQSIHGALTGEKHPRPLTHDLVRSVLEGFDGKVTRVVVTLKGSTYYADLTVTLRGTTKVFDSRSSDAIALAIHFNAPMLVSRELLEKAGKVLEQDTTKPEGTRL